MARHPRLGPGMPLLNPQGRKRAPDHSRVKCRSRHRRTSTFALTSSSLAAVSAYCWCPRSQDVDSLMTSPTAEDLRCFEFKTPKAHKAPVCRVGRW
mmetsp:Transcript_50737/g.91370  ORF Transcript_50737/g.91370 Transcript_50737/m.91370 type:complete len:96 (-) Transcript_50737:483-770(-)